MTTTNPSPRATDTATSPPSRERAHRAAKRYVYAFGAGHAEGDASMRDLLGGKGAGLAEMTNAELPVPPGFTITTEACNDYFAAGERLPDGLWEDVLEALGVACFGIDGYEADDVIGTLATRDPHPVDIVTGDRDLFQLVEDSRDHRVIYVARGVGRAEAIDEAAVTAKYGIPGRAYADFATLRGDPSDGLPGVAGIGDKTAASLITRYGDLASLLEAVEAGDRAMPAGARTKLEAGRDYLAVAPMVVAVAKDAPLPPYDDAIPRLPRDPDRLVELSQRWGLDSPLNRVLAAFEAVHAEG